jgi:hypothetical protein
MDKVIILGHSKPYDFENESKERLTGVKVTFINATPSEQPGCKGFLPLQLSLDPSILDDLKELPGIYEVSYTMKPGKNNAPVATVSSFKFVKSFNIAV